MSEPEAVQPSCTLPGEAAHDPKATVYFDGSCALCRAEISHYRKQEGADAIAFVDVSRENADTGTDLSRAAAMARFHVRDRAGNLISGAQAFASVWGLLPRWRWAARLAVVPGVLPVLEKAYVLFLPVRPYLSRLVARLSREA